MDFSWPDLYQKAMNKITEKTISPFVSIGSETCAILSNNKVYVGTNISANSTLNSCSEKTAITIALADDANDLQKMVILNELGEIILPCNECLIYLQDLSFDKLEVLVSLKPLITKKIFELLPDDWGLIKIVK